MAYFRNNQLRDYNDGFKAIFKNSLHDKLSLKRFFDTNCTQTSSHSGLDDMLSRRKPLHFECCCHNNAWHHIQIYPDPDDDKAYFVSAYDISQFKRRDELLSISSKMEALGQLAGGVAHDFNNILSIVEGYAALIIKDAPDKEAKYVTQLQRILQATKRGAGITRQLLTFGCHKIIGDSRVPLTPFFEEIKNLIYPLLDVEINLEITLDEPDMTIKASTEQLSQIIFNCVTNARDAIGASPAGQIGIHASPKGKDEITITVHDNGCGMSDHVRQKALDPFFTTKPAGKGTGLGLSQIYGMMEQIGGKLEIFSQDGKGTSIVLTFKRGESINIVLPSLDENRGTLKGQTILIVDDEPDLLHVLKITLENEGFIVLTAKSGNEALSIQDEYEHPIHWLLSDVVMGDMNGPKLGKLIDSIRPETKIIYMSGYPASGDMARVQLPEDSIYLAKPLDPQKLIALMNVIGKDDEKNILSVQLSMLAGQWNNKGTGEAP